MFDVSITVYGTRELEFSAPTLVKVKTIIVSVLKCSYWDGFIGVFIQERWTTNSLDCHFTLSDAVQYFQGNDWLSNFVLEV